MRNSFLDRNKSIDGPVAAGIGCVVILIALPVFAQELGPKEPEFIPYKSNSPSVIDGCAVPWLKQKSNPPLAFEFKPLTFWSQFRLGATYFSNSAVAKKVDFAYAFDASDLSKSWKADDLDTVKNLFKQGAVKIGITDRIDSKNSPMLVFEIDSSDLNQHNLLSYIDSIHDVASDKCAVKLVYSQPDLAGKISDHTFFSFDSRPVSFVADSPAKTISK